MSLQVLPLKRGSGGKVPHEDWRFSVEAGGTAALLSIASSRTGLSR
jgi:hypothetical protein